MTALKGIIIKAESNFFRIFRVFVTERDPKQKQQKKAKNVVLRSPAELFCEFLLSKAEQSTTVKKKR